MLDIPVWYRNLIIILASSFLTVNIAMSKIFLDFPSSKNIKRVTKTLTINCSYEQLFGNYVIPFGKIYVGPQLGSGCYGSVFKALAHDLFQPGSKSIVAVKYWTKKISHKNFSQLIYEEMELMNLIGKHKNIINLLGYCPQEVKSPLVLEFAPYGNLRDFLSTNIFFYDESDTSIGMSLEKELVSYSYQIAQGLEYIESRGFVHRDLAARNILVDKNYVVKIADFGKGRKIHGIDYEIGPKLVTGNLWLSPEVIMHQKYDTRSEVWAYGVLLWEIMSLGAPPYTTMSEQQLLVFLQNGNRWSKPEHCSTEIFKLMLECWNFRPELRPTFSKIVNVLHQILRRMPDVKT